MAELITTAAHSGQPEGQTIIRWPAVGPGCLKPAGTPLGSGSQTGRHWYVDYVVDFR